MWWWDACCCCSFFERHTCTHGRRTTWPHARCGLKDARSPMPHTRHVQAALAFAAHMRAGATCLVRDASRQLVVRLRGVVPSLQTDDGVTLGVHAPLLAVARLGPVHDDAGVCCLAKSCQHERASMPAQPANASQSQSTLQLGWLASPHHTITPMGRTCGAGEMKHTAPQTFKNSMCFAEQSDRWLWHDARARCQQLCH